MPSNSSGHSKLCPYNTKLFLAITINSMTNCTSINQINLNQGGLALLISIRCRHLPLLSCEKKCRAATIPTLIGAGIR